MPKITVLVGPPGSGKSTLAAKICFDTNAMYINQDSQGKLHLKLFQDLMNHTPLQNIVVDRMGFNKQQRERYLKPAKEAGYETEIIVLHESRETCLKRCAARIGHPTITTERDANSALDTFFTKYERPTEDEADTIQFVYPELKTNLTTIICDIDNTLSSSNHRQHHVQKPKKHWKAFFDEMGNDPVNEWCKKIVNTLRQNNIITLCSGRPDSYRNHTKEWLEKHKIFHDNLFMRHRADSRADTIIKEILLDYEILTRYSNVLFCIDDRKCVIEMYRSRGLTVLDCAGPAGDF